MENKLFEICYISSNCNATPSVAHWGKNNLICYGSCNCVLIWNPKFEPGGKIIKTLVHNTKRVNSVRWISGCDHETELVAGSSDGTAVVWSFDTVKDNWVPFMLKEHTSNINVVDGLYKDASKKDTVVVTLSMDSTAIIWIRSDLTSNFLKSQTINFGYGIGLAVRLFHLPQDKSLIMAISTDDSKINLYSELSEETNSKISFLDAVKLSGHEDWVRGLDFKLDEEKADLLLASCSQDTFIRLWRITSSENSATSTNAPTFQNNGLNYTIQLESVLAGHEGWIYSVNWSPTNLQLLSSSLDKTMIIWEYDKQIGLWFERIRVGEVGGNTLGFYGGVFGPMGRSVLGHSYHGAFHIWNCIEGELWEPAVTVGGHFGEVVDLAWDPEDGMFVISVSADQTTRIHAPWCAKGSKSITWHEIARPQIHGYDLGCLALISRYKFASGAEEKVMRAFEAPENFVGNFKRICDIPNAEITNDSNTAPRGASVPSLGLSNKAVYENSNENGIVKNSKDPYPEESHFVATELTAPPTEETLLQNTLWPEIQKLYGHGYEIYSLAASPDHKLLASACKATTTEHASILIWDTTSWKQIQKLISHNLTVAQLAFSPNSKYLLSVSRDRRWTLFLRDFDSNQFSLIATVDKKTSIHTRIIWCCAWTHDSEYFATGSRDGKVVIWKERSSSENDVLQRYGPASVPLELKGESVTALAFAPSKFESLFLIAIGLESGKIILYKWREQEWNQVLMLDESFAHHLSVKRLSFRPVLGCAGQAESNDSVLQLASCGADHSVRIYNLFLDKL